MKLIILLVGLICLTNFAHALKKNYDLTPYTYNPLIKTSWSKNPEIDLCTFLEQQFHWRLGSPNHKDQAHAFMKKMRFQFPKALTVLGEGPEESGNSDYLIFGVFHQELQALKHYLGEKKARAVFKGRHGKTWAGGLVLKHEKSIGQALKESGLPISD